MNVTNRSIRLLNIKGAVDYLCIALMLLFLSACRVTFVNDDDDSSSPQFLSELFLFDNFNQSSRVFNLGENITIELTISNLTDNDQTLEFGTDQQFDIYIVDSDFNPVWVWSEQQTLDSSNTVLNLLPNQVVTFNATWDQQDSNGQAVSVGDYQVQALFPVVGEGLNLHFSQQQSEFRTNTQTFTLQ